MGVRIDFLLKGSIPIFIFIKIILLVFIKKIVIKVAKAAPVMPKMGINK